SELRIILLGNSWSERSSAGNFILGETVFNTEEEPDHCQTVRGLLMEQEIVLINTPDLLHPNISEDKLTEHVETCVRLSDPGPHVFLLVLQPEDFTEDHKKGLQSILELFSDRSFDHSVILTSPPKESSDVKENNTSHQPLKEMIRMCRKQVLWKNTVSSELLAYLDQIAKKNGGAVSCIAFADSVSAKLKQQETISASQDHVKVTGE
ncbi:GTPase IMAP family member 5-like, partial [Scomber scombrus]